MDDSFYAFTRGSNQEVLVATTNQGSGSDQQRSISHLPYSDGQGETIHVLTSLQGNDESTISSGDCRTLPVKI